MTYQSEIYKDRRGRERERERERGTWQKIRCYDKQYEERKMIYLFEGFSSSYNDTIFQESRYPLT